MSDAINGFLDEVGISVTTEELFLLERSQLEKQFLDTCGITPERIEQQIRDGMIAENDLVQRWIDLQAIESSMYSQETRKIT